ncbi:MAG TPA: hypothetical protein HA349_10985 [Methanotrichaceae archaeon]|nr:hypothetical protein [Methanotrichaceae archaeon]
MKRAYAILAVLFLLCGFVISTGSAATDLSGKYVGTGTGVVINSSSGEIIIPPATANVSMTIEQTGHLLIAEYQVLGVDDKPVGDAFYMVGSTGDNYISLYYAGNKKTLGESVWLEGITTGEVLKPGELGFSTVGGGYDKDKNMLFTWTEIDLLKKVDE